MCRRDGKHVEKSNAHAEKVKLVYGNDNNKSNNNNINNIN